MKALIITYYFPPCNGVPGWRPYSWFKHFPSQNIQSTVITRHWSGNEKTWDDSIKENKQSIVIENHDDSQIVRLPYTHSFLKRLSDSSFFKIKFFSQFYHLFIRVMGKMAIEIDANHVFKKYITTHLQVTDYDFIVVSSPPLNLLQLGHSLSKKYNIPLIVDFRDLWDNDELKTGYVPGFKKKIDNSITKAYMKHWLKNAKLILTVSPAMVKYLQTITKQEVIEITNGFEDELFLKNTTEPTHVRFTISVIGTIYSKQDISVIINGLTLFLSKIDHQDIRLNFIGVESIKEVADKIKQELPAGCCFFSERILREEAIHFTLQSHVLLYAGWKGYQGIYSGKIFDYLGAKRNILIAPGDDDVIDEIVTRTQAGKIANTEAEFSFILLNWYMEWKKNGKLSYNGIDELINSYSRQNQANLLASHILSKFNKS